MADRTQPHPDSVRKFRLFDEVRYSADSTESSDGEDAVAEDLFICSRFCSLQRRAASKVLEMRCWTALVMTAIAVNTVMMALECTFPEWDYWDAFEAGFLVFFCFEMAVRLYVHQCSFFTCPTERMWNIFELTVVVAGILEDVLPLLIMGPGRFMILLRIMRLIRILRSFRLVKHFKQLYLLVQGFVHSMYAVFWIGVLFLGVVFIAGIFVTTVIGNNADEWASGENGSEDEANIKSYFGSLQNSMLTMFQMVTLDNWGDINTLVMKRQPLMPLFFIPYTLMTAFAMIALLTGVITEHVTSVAQQSQKAEEEQHFMEYVDSLVMAFSQSGKGGESSDGLTFAELRSLLEDPQVASKITQNNASIDSNDLQDIFKAMDLSGDGRVSWEEFRRGLQDMSGPATAKEVALLRADLIQLCRHVRSKTGRALDQPLRDGRDETAGLGERMSRLESQVERIEAALDGFIHQAMYSISNKN